jgi:hypothetical protein
MLGRFRRKPRVSPGAPWRPPIEDILREVEDPWYERWPHVIGRAIRRCHCRVWGHKQPYRQRIGCMTCTRCGQVVQAESRALPAKLAQQVSPPKASSPPAKGGGGGDDNGDPYRATEPPK